MDVHDEGYIKYLIHWKKSEIPAVYNLTELISYRNLLFKEKLLGSYANGTGYGNISQRIHNSSQFIISGTQTGNIPVANKNHFSLVTGYDIHKNELYCSGNVKASSEALTHAAFYETGKKINAVIHMHHDALWHTLLNQVPTTLEDIAYGTAEMANEVKRIVLSDNSTENKIIVMAGHYAGIFTFGNNLKEAYHVSMQYVKH